jgi:predicted esterase
MSNVICLEERRIRRAIHSAEDRLCHIRTLISHGDYDKIAEAMELEAAIVSLENNLILLIDRDVEDMGIPPIFEDQ